MDNQCDTKISSFSILKWWIGCQTSHPCLTSKDSPFIEDGVCTPLASIMNIQQTTKTVFVDFTPIMLFTSWVVRPEIFWPHFGCSSVGLKCNGPRTAAICEHSSSSKWNQNEWIYWNDTPEHFARNVETSAVLFDILFHPCVNNL